MSVFMLAVSLVVLQRDGDSCRWERVDLATQKTAVIGIVPAKCTSLRVTWSADEKRALALVQYEEKKRAFEIDAVRGGVKELPELPPDVWHEGLVFDAKGRAVLIGLEGFPIEGPDAPTWDEKAGTATIRGVRYDVPSNIGALALAHAWTLTPKGWTLTETKGTTSEACDTPGSRVLAAAAPLHKGKLGHTEETVGETMRLVSGAVVVEARRVTDDGLNGPYDFAAPPYRIRGAVLEGTEDATVGAVSIRQGFVVIRISEPDRGIQVYDAKTAKRIFHAPDASSAELRP